MTTELSIVPLREWFGDFEQPLLISGPCSAESEQQLLQTAQLLKKIPQIKVFRAGIWKPRTRPSGFEGVGTEGLKWLREVREQTGLLTAVEVASPKHVELALMYDVDIFWIGARTVVNPFSVQELAEAMNGINRPVMVKNPLNPDLKLWIGALERINKSGIRKIAAIHRGFHHYEKSLYRNAPMWGIPIELKRLTPELPVLVDPSHIAGRRDLLFRIAQKALDLEMDGLMIEAHMDPDHALTDAAQQIHPDQLQLLINKLIVPSKSTHPVFETRLESLRTEIDKLDGELLEILASRMRIVEEIGAYKADHNISILQLQRWKEVIEDRLAIGTNLGLPDKFLGNLWDEIHELSINIQTETLRRKRRMD